MKLFVVRHGEAVDPGDELSDERRFLTPDGRVSFRKTAVLMKKEGVRPSAILTSPLIRAVQTADVLAEALGYKGDLAVADELGPGFDEQGLSMVLARFPAARELVLVGHNPDLSSLVGSLLRRSTPLSLKKGAVVALRVDPADLGRPAEFRWIIVGGKSPERLVKDISVI